MPERRDDTMAHVRRSTCRSPSLLPRAHLPATSIGYLLDKAFGTSFLRIVCLILGIVGGSDRGNSRACSKTRKSRDRRLRFL